nr:NADH dehydrogenase subunit 4L [Moina macrocopa]BDH80292.1 NADH dehydrogenase subunit 4L [Moina macrocopa]
MSFDGLLLVMLFMGFIMFMFAFISKRKHLLATLLSLEGLMLMVFSLFYYYSAYMVSFQGFLLVFLTLAACEGALGLSLLVLMVRGYGGDHFQSFSFLQC